MGGFGLVLSALLGCGSDRDAPADDSAALCQLAAGPWTFRYTPDPDADPSCPGIADWTAELGGPVASTSSTCDVGCACSGDPFVPPDCAATLHEACSVSGVDTTTDCAMVLVAADRLEGQCDRIVSSGDGDLFCGYSYVGSLD